MSLKERIIKSKFIFFIYKCKVYLDLGIAQVSWFTAKIPEVAGVLIIINFFGIDLGEDQFIYAIAFGIIALFIIGMFFKKAGLYILQRHAETRIDPIQQEIYKMAIDYNKRRGKNEKIKEKTS